MYICRLCPSTYKWSCNKRQSRSVDLSRTSSKKSPFILSQEIYIKIQKEQYIKNKKKFFEEIQNYKKEKSNREQSKNEGGIVDYNR